MSEFKVGDKVKIVEKDPNDPFDIGDIGTVIETCWSHFKIKNKKHDGDWMSKKELELVSKETFTISEALKLAIDGHKLTNDKISDPKTKYIFFDGEDFMFQGDELEKAWGILGIEHGWYLFEEPKTTFVPQFSKGEFFANVTGDFGKVLDIIESTYLVTFNGRTKIKYKEEQMVKLEESK